MITLSLLQTSQNRKEELKRFILSLNEQKSIDFAQIQLIFVDQGNNKEIFESLHPEIEFTYIKAERCSLSHARNIGLKKVKGKYIGFPDDDCWYESDTLSRVLTFFRNNNYQGVSGIGKNEDGFLTSSFPSQEAIITPTKRCAAISYTLFFLFNDTVFFDENIGVGSPYNLGSGEETDYLLTLIIKFNYKVHYDPQIIIHHPVQNTNDKDKLIEKAYSYSRGTGYLLQKHRFSKYYKFKNIIRPLAGSVVHLIIGDITKAKKSYSMFKGKIEGYNFKFKQ